MANDNKKKKARSSYNWFITDGDWDEDEIAQRKADLFFEELGLKEGNRILLIIDDTYNEKKGKHTEGVGKFFDHSKGFIWGNSIVTSVLQAKGLFIPHKAKIYVKKEDAASDFKTKIQIAIKDIIKPLKVPAGTEVMVVFDSWWYSAALIKSCREMGHHVTCQIKSDKKVLLDNSESLQVKNFAKRFNEEDFKEIRMNVRGKKKSYSVVDKIVGLDKTRQVRLVISKQKEDSEPKYYICTDITWMPRRYFRYTRIDGISRRLTERQIRSWDSRIISFEASVRSRDSCNWFSLFGQGFSWLRSRVLLLGEKRKRSERWSIRSNTIPLSIW